MQDSPHKLGLILDTITDGILVVDVTGTVLYANQAATTILERGPLTGKSLGIPLGGQHDSFLEINLVRRSGLGWAELRSTPIDWEGIQAFVIGLRDITELKTSQSELEFLTHHDPLTKLPNRLLFLTQLQHAIDKAQRRRISLAVLMMDLDHFKNINDSFGHRVGDDLLHIMADRLKHHIRSTDLPCRLGGDEFVVMIEDIPHAESVARIANQIIGVLNESCTSENGQEMRVGVSIGIAIFPDHGLTASELMQHADAALYQAKK
ncbi:MAG: GGDEF domain-containing protein, partial [Methylomonas sp.]